MNSADPFETFCAAVCAKVRWPFARWDITQELTGHLQDHAASLEEKGLSPEEAQSQAVAAMGDPAELGRALNRVHSPPLGPDLRRPPPADPLSGFLHLLGRFLAAGLYLPALLLLRVLR